MDLKRIQAGLINIPFWDCYNNYPELKDILDSFNPKEFPKELYCFDIRIHSLSPGEYPGIFNWHHDTNTFKSNIKPTTKLYLWVSNEPLTEFQEYGKIPEKTWFEFNTNDLHRALPSKTFCDRLFIRAAPEIYCYVPSSEERIRTKSIVYLEKT